jgi:hypothetical protein
MAGPRPTHPRNAEHAESRGCPGLRLAEAASAARAGKPRHDGGEPPNIIQPSIFSNASIDMFFWISG